MRLQFVVVVVCAPQDEVKDHGHNEKETAEEQAGAGCQQAGVEPKGADRVRHKCLLKIGIRDWELGIRERLIPNS